MALLDFQMPEMDKSLRSLRRCFCRNRSCTSRRNETRSRRSAPTQRRSCSTRPAFLIGRLCQSRARSSRIRYRRRRLTRFLASS
jgi:hypothetical protein